MEIRMNKQNTRAISFKVLAVTVCKNKSTIAGEQKLQDSAHVRLNILPFDTIRFPFISYQCYINWQFFLNVSSSLSSTSTLLNKHGSNPAKNVCPPPPTGCQSPRAQTGLLLDLARPFLSVVHL